MKKATFLVPLLLSICSAALVQQQALRGPSTPEERQRFVTLTHKMEDAPLDESLRSEREWALVWLVQIPDITVNVCTAPLGDYMKKKYKYSPEITIQLTFSSGAFIIEHPEKAKDEYAQCLAGVEGALKAYQSILKVKPDAHSKALDELLDKQRTGKLAEHVQEATSKATK
ncbi:MAG TPA: hypothetical protein VJW20_03990 [Candidatus Angelobacter sp.]|nr:hypothetical protein [Candidatus Angelobacter sp.]